MPAPIRRCFVRWFARITVTSTRPPGSPPVKGAHPASPVALAPFWRDTSGAPGPWVRGLSVESREPESIKFALSRHSRGLTASTLIAGQRTVRCPPPPRPTTVASGHCGPPVCGPPGGRSRCPLSACSSCENQPVRPALGGVRNRRRTNCLRCLGSPCPSTLRAASAL